MALFIFTFGLPSWGPFLRGVAGDPFGHLLFPVRKSPAFISTGNGTDLPFPKHLLPSAFLSSQIFSPPGRPRLSASSFSPDRANWPTILWGGFCLTVFPRKDSWDLRPALERNTWKGQRPKLQSLSGEDFGSLHQGRGMKESHVTEVWDWLNPYNPVQCHELHRKLHPPGIPDFFFFFLKNFLTISGRGRQTLALLRLTPERYKRQKHP